MGRVHELGERTVFGGDDYESNFLECRGLNYLIKRGNVQWCVAYIFL